MTESESGKLSHEDIKALMENPDPEMKITVIEKLSNQYNTESLTDAQVRLAEQIFRLLLQQAEVEVRKALSENLMSSKAIPHDVVFSLARDVEEVSLPVLEFSEVLTDEDLVEIINSTEHLAPSMAIANRGIVSPAVSTALVDTENEEVVGTLLQNDMAQISDSSFEKVVDIFPDSEKIVDSMVTRGSLSNRIIERMTTKVSGVIQKKLEKKYKGSFGEINEFFKESGEVAALKFMTMQAIDKDLMELVDDLEKNNQLIQALHPVNGMLTQLLDGLEQIGKLTPLSALSMGHLVLFEISLSRLTGVPFSNVQKLVGDREGGLYALYDRAQLPPKLFDAVFFIIDVINTVNEQAEKNNTPRANMNLYIFMKAIMKESKGQQIRNLAHFITAIRSHIEAAQSEW